MTKAIIFDLDDTLISEKKYVESGFRHLSKILRNRLNKDEQAIYDLLLKLFNENSRNVFNRLFDSYEISYSKVDVMELVEHYRNHLPNISFFNDVTPCLEELRNRGLKLGIITDGYASAQRRKIEALNAYKYFDEIIITDELGREYWKPHPRAFELMKQRLEVEFNEMVYVGDNPEKDFYISSIYPIKTVRLLRDGIYSEKSYLNNIRENNSIYSLTELISVI